MQIVGCCLGREPVPYWEVQGVKFVGGPPEAEQLRRAHGDDPLFFVLDGAAGGDEFKKINALRAEAGRPPIAWEPGAPVVAFTDGACSANGKPGAAASFAAVVRGGLFGRTEVCGGVAAAAYEFCDEDELEKGVRPAAATAAAAVPPSNNRGELLGIVWALVLFLRAKCTGSMTVVSDSKIYVEQLETHFANHLARGTAGKRKNLDLLACAHRLAERLRARGRLSFVHTRGHARGFEGESKFEELCRRGNARADALAEGVADRADPAPVCAGPDFLFY